MLLFCLILRYDVYNNASCAGKCACDSEVYFPVCGENGVSYKSPCHAGCVTNDNQVCVHW